MSRLSHILRPPGFVTKVLSLPLAFFVPFVFNLHTHKHPLPMNCPWPDRFRSVHLCACQSLVLTLITPLTLSFFPFILPSLFPVSSFYFWFQEQLDVALSKTCKHFDDLHYTKVQLAYSLLGKTQVSGSTTLCSSTQLDVVIFSLSSLAS